MNNYVKYYYVLHKNSFWKPITLEDKFAIIAKALSTSTGRTALAQSMVAPIRQALNYDSIGRRLLMVEDLP